MHLSTGMLRAISRAAAYAHGGDTVRAVASSSASTNPAGEPSSGQDRGPLASTGEDGIQNRDMGPGDYSQPQIRPEVYAAGAGGDSDASQEQRNAAALHGSDEAKRGGHPTLEVQQQQQQQMGSGGVQQGPAFQQEDTPDNTLRQAASGAEASRLDVSPPSDADRLEAAGQGQDQEQEQGQGQGKQQQRADDTAAAAVAPTGKLVDPGRVHSEGSDLPPGHSGRGATLDSTAEQADA